MRWVFLVEFWIAGFLALLLSGCSQTNLADVLAAAAKDPATICGSAMYAGASVTFARTNITNGAVDCNNGHLTIQTTPTAQPIGVQLVPVPTPSSDPFGPGTPPVVSPSGTRVR